MIASIKLSTFMIYQLVFKKVKIIIARPTTHILAFAKVVFKYKHVAQKSDAHIGRLLYQRLRPCKDTEG